MGKTSDNVELWGKHQIMQNYGGKPWSTSTEFQTKQFVAKVEKENINNASGRKCKNLRVHGAGKAEITKNQ